MHYRHNQAVLLTRESFADLIAWNTRAVCKLLQQLATVTLLYGSCIFATIKLCFSPVSRLLTWSPDIHVCMQVTTVCNCGAATCLTAASCNTCNLVVLLTYESLAGLLVFISWAPILRIIPLQFMRTLLNSHLAFIYLWAHDNKYCGRMQNGPD